MQKTRRRTRAIYVHFYFHSIWRKCIISTCRTMSRLYLTTPPSSVTVSYNTLHLQSDLWFSHALPLANFTGPRRYSCYFHFIFFSSDFQGRFTHIWFWPYHSNLRKSVIFFLGFCIFFANCTQLYIIFILFSTWFYVLNITISCLFGKAIFSTRNSMHITIPPHQ